jgi:hypothetical protein
MACAQCGAVPVVAVFYNDRAYCSFRCCHNAGDRSACGPSCGCTAYARKRRALRRHREQLRFMRNFIEEEGMGEELDAALDYADVPNFWLGQHPELDEDSDEPDPVRLLLDEEKARAQMLQAVQGALESQAIRRDLERARMQLEDERSRQAERSKQEEENIKRKR